MSILFTPIRVRDTEFRNRLWVAPMCQYSAVDGMPAGWHRSHLLKFADGGAGLIIAEATAVAPEGRITPHDTGLWSDAQRDAWAAIVAEVHERSAKIAIQLGHAGRKASTWWPWAPQQGVLPLEHGGWPVVAPSALPYGDWLVPAELTKAEIDTIVTQFVESALRAVDAGFDAIEIHAAHGYLVHQFLSPLSNTRCDEYGGSPENRALLLLRIVREVRAAVGEKLPIFVRYSATDAAPGGLEVADVTQFVTWARAAGADFADVSSAGLVAHQEIHVSPGYQVPLAAEIRSATGVVTGAVGLISEPHQAEQILERGHADVVLSAREWLRNPNFALHAADALGESAMLWPRPYLRARRTPRPQPTPAPEPVS